LRQEVEQSVPIDLDPEVFLSFWLEFNGVVAGEEEIPVGIKCWTYLEDVEFDASVDVAPDELQMTVYVRGN